MDSTAKPDPVAPREPGRPSATDSIEGPAADSCSTAAFLARLRRAVPPDDAPEAPSIPGVTILERVGCGGMGVVYRGRDDATGREVAVKVLWGAGAASPTAQERVRREAEILTRLEHPHIVRVLASGGSAGPEPGLRQIPYIVMEWIPGGTLEQLVGPERLDRREAARVVRDLARAVAEVHALGAIHRDIKPANVLLDRPPQPGDPPVPRLADFGLARHQLSETRLTHDGTVLGTPGYLAPEQVGLDPELGPVGPATDIHGLGATLYFLLAGRPPHAGRSFVESLARALRGAVDWSGAALADLPADLRTIVEKCLERSPRARYASARDLADDLGAFLDHRPIRARRGGPVERIGKWSRRHPATAAGGAIAILALAVMAGGAIVHVARVSSAEQATVASRERARQMVVRLTDERMQQILASGKPLDEQGRRFLTEARDTFRKWPLEGDVREALLFRVGGSKSLARSFATLGWIDDAVECFADCHVAFDEIDRRALGDARVRAIHFAVLCDEYRLFIETGRPAAAAPLVARALALTSTPLDPPLGPATQAMVLVDKGFMLSSLGRHDESAPVITAALAALRQAVIDHPGDPGVAQVEQSGLYNAAICSANAGRREEQLDRLRTLVERSGESLARCADPVPALRQSRLGALATLASASLAAGLADEAMTSARKLAEETRAALAAAPDDPFLRGRLFDAATLEAQATMRLGRPEEAAAPIDEAVRLAEVFVADEPALFFHVRRLALALRDQAAQRATSGRPTDTIGLYTRLREVLEPWQDADAHREEVVNLIAMAYGEEAVQVRRGGDLVGAIALLGKAVGLATNRQRGQLLLALADFAAAAGDDSRARESLAEAMEDPGCVDAARAILARIDRRDP
jgi:tetratricopeptide (TPR) repeat protein